MAVFKLSKRPFILVPWVLLALGVITVEVVQVSIKSTGAQSVLGYDDSSAPVFLEDKSESSARTSDRKTKVRLPSLGELTEQQHNDTLASVEATSCHGNLTLITNTPLDRRIHPATGGIPRIIHQTSKSRCVAPIFADRISTWRRIKDFAYCFHTDEAVLHILEKTEFSEFPLLRDAMKCVTCMTMKSDVWRYLILWLHGGIYVDIDTIPGKAYFSPGMDFCHDAILHNESDAVFIVEVYGMLSQYYMAVKPRHPIMYYAVQVSLNNIFESKNIHLINPALATGPHALHRAFELFLQDASHARPPQSGAVEAGVYMGRGGRKVVVIGKKQRSDKHVVRNSIGFPLKVAGYELMGMKYFNDELERKTKLFVRQRNDSCIAVLYARRNADH